MKYKGKKCVLCGNEFSDGDDVVVCPDCGSPHHRECYSSKGECANRHLHEEGFDWNKLNSPIDIFRRELSDMSEEPVNMPENIGEIPEHDGLKKMGGYDESGCSFREILDFVNVNVLYYVPVFMRIRNMGKVLSINLMCLISPQVYFASRKMWFWALITTLVSVLLLIPFMLANLAVNGEAAGMSESVIAVLKANAASISSLADICSGIETVIRVFFCLFGNKLYYDFVVRSIKRIKEKCNEDISREQLISAGGVSILNIFVIVMLMMVTVAAVLLAVEIVLENMF